jgi:hypothetical protein
MIGKTKGMQTTVPRLPDAILTGRQADISHFRAAQNHPALGTGKQRVA